MPDTDELSTKPDRVVDALYRQIKDHPAFAEIRVEKNIAPPETLADKECLIVVRTGTPGEPDPILGFRSVFYSHALEIEMYAAAGNGAVREQRFSNLQANIGVALETDITLGGLVQGMDYGAPSPITEYTGGADIKSGVIDVTADYQADTPLG